MLIMGQIQTYTPNTNYLNIFFLLKIAETYLPYEVGEAILDNNDDDDIDGGVMMYVAEGTQA